MPTLTRQLARWFAVALAVGVCAGALAGGAAGPRFPRIANVYGLWLTPDTAYVAGQETGLEELARYDLLLGVNGPWQDPASWPELRRRLDSLRARNPHLRALSFVYSAPYTYPEVLNWHSFYVPPPAGAWLLSTDGRRIRGWPGTYMLDLTRPEVIEWMAQGAVWAAWSGGYDGVFVDSMMPGFDYWACEIATGEPYAVDLDGDGQEDPPERLNPLWRSAKQDLGRRIRELLGDGSLFMGNQAGDDLHGELNGIYLEDYVDAVVAGVWDWEHLLDTYLRWTDTPRRPNLTVLGCSSGVEPPFDVWDRPEEERAALLARGRGELQRMRFGLTTALMGDGYYSYDMHTRWRGQLWWYPEFDAPLGYPTGPPARHPDGTWRRAFDGGLVVVNPTRWDVQVELAQHAQDVSSRRVGTTFAIPAMDGRILVPTDEAPRAGDWEEPRPLLTRDGPAGVVTRGDSVVIRWGEGAAARLDGAGNLVGLWASGEDLLTSVRAVMVADERWQDFAASDFSHDVHPDGTLAFRGRRSDDGQTLEYVQTVAAVGASLVIEYRWRAVTALHLHAFRQFLALPVGAFGGGMARHEGGEVPFPEERAERANLAGDLRDITLVTRAGARLRVSLPQSGYLLDERHYGGSGYILAFHPVGGDIEAGREWSYRITLTPAGR